MKLIEIFDSPSRTEYNDNYIHYFISAPTICKVPGTNYILKIAIDKSNETIKYGIFHKSKLISYLSIHIVNNIAVVGLPSTDSNYQQRGLMTFLYNYIIIKDGYQLMSDNQHTPEAKKLWKSCQRNHFFNIDVININTNERHPWNGDDEPWSNQSSEIRLIAYRFTNEQHVMMEQFVDIYSPRVIRRRLGMDNPELYGPNSYKIYTNHLEIAP